MIADEWLSRFPRRDWLGWILCLAAIALAASLRLAFPLSGPFITFYPAILFCTLVGGMRAGVVALLAGLVVAPIAVAGLDAPVIAFWPVVSWLSFAAFGYVIIWAIDLMQRTLQASRKLTEQLRR